MSKSFILSLFICCFTQCQAGSERTTSQNDSIKVERVNEGMHDALTVNNDTSLKHEIGEGLGYQEGGSVGPKRNSEAGPSKEDLNHESNQSQHKVYIDREGFTVKDGRRIFPLGVFTGGAKTTDDHNLSRISKAGFNTILSYEYGTGDDRKGFLDRAKRNNLNVIYSLKGMYPKSTKDTNKMNYFIREAEKLIDKVKEHDAILAWYINDELDTPWIPMIKQMYNLVKQRDPHHPTFQVLYQENILNQYRNITDVLATDSYGVGGPNLRKTSVRTKLAMNAMRHRPSQNNKAVWQVSQMYDKSVYDEKIKPRAPMTEEMRNQAYQAIVHGAKGIIFYSYFDLFKEKNPKTKMFDEEHFNKRWEDVSRMAKEISSITPILLNGNEIDIEVKKKSYDEGEVLAVELGKTIYLFLANPYYSKQSISIKMPDRYTVAKKTQNQITGMVQNNILLLTLPDLASGIFQLQKK